MHIRGKDGAVVGIVDTMDPGLTQWHQKNKKANMKLNAIEMNKSPRLRFHRPIMLFDRDWTPPIYRPGCLSYRWRGMLGTEVLPIIGVLTSMIGRLGDAFLGVHTGSRGRERWLDGRLLEQSA